MPKEPELKARDKVVLRMTREGAVEENLTAGTEQRVSKRPEDAELVKPAETAAPSEALSAEEQKKVQMRRQQRQFQAERAEDNDTQPPSETSVTEEKRAENSSYSVQIGKTTFIVCVKQSETAKKPIEKMFKDMCRHEVTRDFLADNLMNLEKLPKTS